MSPIEPPAVTFRGPRPRVTVAAVIEQSGRYLMVEEHTAEGLRLNTPAGHLEAGESPEQAVCRETLEETARAFQPEAFLGVYLSRFRGGHPDEASYVRLAYCGSVGAELPGRVLDTGIVRTVWMSLAELRACPQRHRSPLVMRCLEDHAAGRRLPLQTVTADASLWAV